MKRWILTFCLLALVAVGQQTPSQVASSARAFQALSDRDLEISSTFLLLNLSGLTLTPSQVLTNAASYQALSDRDLKICQTFLLSQFAGGFLVHSNTLASIPILNPGDTFYWSSNGVAYVITDSPGGVLATNKLGP